jgi:hypothetical protein
LDEGEASGTEAFGTDADGADGDDGDDGSDGAGSAK